MTGGGEVVGAIPAGVPIAASMPRFDWDTFVMLLSTAFVIMLVAFMEAISIAKAMATRTQQRIDPNQELIGQGLANIVGSLCQSFPVSGSFSRSAVNLSAGAVTGMSSVVAGVLVLVTLLFFTPLLYHLPQAALAAVIMMAVVNLVDFARDTPRVGSAPARRHRGAGDVRRDARLRAASRHRHPRPARRSRSCSTSTARCARASRSSAAIRRDAARRARCTTCARASTSSRVRFDGSLYFANVPYFEDAVLEQSARHPNARYILIVGDGINEIDASGEEVIRHLVARLQENGITMVFSGLKTQVLRVMEKTGLYALIGAQNFFRTEDAALDAIYQWVERSRRSTRSSAR